MSRYIDADKVLDKMRDTFDMQDLYLPIHLKELIIDDIPTADVRENVHGKWLYGESEEGNDGYFCNMCGNFVPWIYADFDISFIKEFNFCPKCGAEMREVGE